MISKEEIREKLNKKYNYSLWKEIISEIFPNKEFFTTSLNKPLNESETKTAKSIKQFGQINLTDNRKIALFEVELKSNKDVNRNRVELRGLISKDLLSGVKDGALVVYYSAEKPQYRFTFIAKQTKITETGDFEESETDTKRFTYVLGETETCNTPADRFFKLSEIKEKKLSDIEEAFSVEKVSKEFFGKYKEHFDKFNQFSYENFKNLLPFSHYHEDQKEKAIRDFNKKLLGRIVFIYFLQKKGWIGVPVADGFTSSDKWTCGSTRFLSENFNKNYKNSEKIFYLDFLEPLFYDTLNKKRENDIFSLTNSKIPFLNGGLFEEDPIEKRYLLFYPNELFQNLFEYFDQYNFTIIEDSVEEQEVAIDPEMLGHIFENLLEDNKDKGTFYTPKEIVKYMCQEALINYLDTNTGLLNSGLQPTAISDFIKYGIREDNKNLIKKHAKKIEELLDDVKILDPAIGSGAFPMGMLHEIFNAKLNLDWTLDKAETKRKIIENSIYGVDIEKGAVDIAMLRFWLSLVVDEEEPSPLPNLDYKIMVGNSLTGDNVDTGNMFHKHFLDEIQNLRHAFYKVNEPAEKKKLKKQIDDETKKLASSLNVNLDDGFNFKIEFSEVFDKKGGFDIVIGNPPYFNVQTLGAKSSLVKILQTKYKDIWMDKSDILFYFIRKAVELSNKDVIFIISNAFLFSDKAKKLRNFILEKAPIRKIVNFEQKMVFENALITSAIVSFEKLKKDYILDSLVIKDKYLTIEQMNSYINNPNKFIKVELKKDNVFALIDKKVADLNNRIDSKGQSLSDLILVGKGMETASNEVFLFENQPEHFPKEFIKKRVSGQNIERYKMKGDFDYLLYFEDVEKFELLPKSIQEHLLNNEQILKNRATVKNEGRAWWRYSRPMHKSYYNLNKIWTSYRSKENCFAYDDTKEFIGLTNTTVIFDTNKNINLKYVLALLNSKTLNFRYRSIGKQTGGGIFEYFENGIGKLPIPEISINKQEVFTNLVDYIMYLKKEDNAQVNEYVPNSHIANIFEEVLDGCVYELFFEEEMKQKEIDILKYVRELIKPINNLDSIKSSKIIHDVYQILREQNNEVRNRLILFAIRSEETILVIKKAT